jgi:hypothetical protein
MSNSVPEKSSQLPATLPDSTPPQPNVPALPLSEPERLLAQWSQGQPTFLTNLALTGEEGLVLATKASAASDQMTAQASGRLLLIRGFVLAVWDKTDAETGEQLKLLGANLVLQNGEMVGTTSAGVLRCLKMISQSRPKGEWAPPVPCLIEAHKGSQAGPYYTMRVLSKDEVAALAKKK